MVFTSLSALFTDNIDTDDLYLVSVWHLEDSAIGDGYIAKIHQHDQQVYEAPAVTHFGLLDPKYATHN